MLNPEHLLRQARDNIRKNWKQETIVQVDPTTHLAPDGPPAEAATEPVGSGQPHDSDAFASNIPRCVVCGGVARPAVKMFQDSDTWVDADDSGRFNEFLGATNAFFARLCAKNEIILPRQARDKRAERESQTRTLVGAGLELSL